MKYFNRQGEEISVDEWHKLYAQADYRSVAYDWEADFAVVTTWLGVGANVYQTVALLPDGDAETCGQYTTEAEAFAGHATAVAEWRAKQ